MEIHYILLNLKNNVVNFCANLVFKFLKIAPNKFELVQNKIFKQV